VEEAAAALNASVRANRLQVKIPVEEPHKKEWVRCLLSSLT
jgi:hypothetical protein